MTFRIYHVQTANSAISGVMKKSNSSINSYVDYEQEPVAICTSSINVKRLAKVQQTAD